MIIESQVQVEGDTKHEGIQQNSKDIMGDDSKDIVGDDSKVKVGDDDRKTGACGLCNTNEQITEMAIAFIQFLKIHVQRAQKNSVPLILPIPESVGKDQVMICGSCYEKNETQYSLGICGAIQSQKKDKDCQTDYISNLPKPISTTTATAQPVSKEIEKENKIIKTGKRPYPGSSLPTHVTTSAIRNSPVRVNHSALIHMNRKSDSPLLKRFKNAEDSSSNERKDIANLIAKFEERVVEIQKETVPGSPQEFRQSHFGNSIPRD